MEAFSKLIQSLLNLRRKEHLQVWKQVDLDPIEIWNPLVPESFPLKAALFSFLPNNPHLMVTTSDILSWPCLSGKQFAYSAGDLGSIPGSGRSPGEGNGNPLQYSCLEKSYGQRSLAGHSPWGCRRVRHNLVTKQQLPV